MLNKNRIDVSQCFLVYMSVCGDCERTALALDLDPKLVQELAAKEGWHEKIRRISLLSKSEKPGDFERATNRALNFVQAHRVRLVLDKVIEKFHGLDADETLEMLTTRREGQISYSARFLSDLTSALEKVAFLSYAALGDSISERATREETSDGVDANDLHKAVLMALNNPEARFKESDLLVAEASQVVKQLAAPVELPVAGVSETIESKTPGNESPA